MTLGGLSDLRGPPLNPTSPTINSTQGRRMQGTAAAAHRCSMLLLHQHPPAGLLSLILRPPSLDAHPAITHPAPFYYSSLKPGLSGLGAVGSFTSAAKSWLGGKPAAMKVCRRRRTRQGIRREGHAMQWLPHAVHIAPMAAQAGAAAHARVHIQSELQHTPF